MIVDALGCNFDGDKMVAYNMFDEDRPERHLPVTQEEFDAVAAEWRTWNAWHDRIIISEERPATPVWDMFRELLDEIYLTKEYE